MLSDPQLEQRPLRHYVSIHGKARMHQLPQYLGSMFDELAAWIEQHGVVPSGAAFIRYNVIDMENELEFEVGQLVPENVQGDNRVQAGQMPGGRYLTAVYTGDSRHLMDATAQFLEWAAKHHIQWNVNGQRWAGRFEFYLSDPAEEPDWSKHRTELAFLTA